MSTYAGSAIRQVNSYHQNLSLLFQFILTEFIESFAEIKQLTTLCNAPVQSTGSNGHAIFELKSSLMLLVGSSRSALKASPWNSEEGLLMKLKMYCALFLQNAEDEGKELIAMQHYIDKSWQTCIQAMEILCEKPFNSQHFAELIEKALASTQRFSKLIMRLLHQFRDDENVMFFIIKNHKIIDRLYGSRYVYKLMGRLYNKGIREVQQLLTKKYSERGFDKIVTAIESHILDIEAAAL